MGNSKPPLGQGTHIGIDLVKVKVHPVAPLSPRAKAVADLYVPTCIPVNSTDFSSILSSPDFRPKFCGFDMTPGLKKSTDQLLIC